MARARTHAPSPRLRRRALGAAVAALVALSAGALVPAAGASSPAVHADVDPALTAAVGTVAVVVQETPDAGSAPEDVVTREGGRVTQQLPLVGGFAAELPAEAVDDLAGAPGVRVVSADRAVTVAQADGGAGGPRSVFRETVRADALEAEGRGGAGVTVALIDTGVDPLPDVADRLVQVRQPGGHSTPCLNLSGEPGCADSYGHGTFLAGLVAGDGDASGGVHRGTAPAARVLSVKIAGRDGSADVSTVIAALQWVVNQRDEHGIRVVNLSLGTNSTQSYRVDPLNRAVERAWAAGLVVVVAASNLGPEPGTVTKPGDDPFVITVGAVDDRGTVGHGDDVVPHFSARGPTAADGLAKPDLVAPGAHLVSLSAPGSTIAEQFPSSMAAPYRRGSGTSMATAVTSGAVALLLGAQPGLQPDEVKHRLTATARPVASSDRYAVGAGLLDVAAAAHDAPPGRANAGVVPSDGSGSVAGSRGTVRIAVDGTVLGGELRVQVVDGSGPLGGLLGQLSYGLLWAGSNWHGSNWHGSNWHGSNWHGSNWHGSNWHGAEFYGAEQPTDYGEGAAGSASYGAWDR